MAGNGSAAHWPAKSTSIPSMIYNKLVDKCQFIYAKHNLRTSQSLYSIGATFDLSFRTERPGQWIRDIILAMHRRNFVQYTSN